MKKFFLALILLTIGNFMVIAQAAGGFARPSSPMSSLIAPIGIACTIIGLFIIALSDVFLLIRETALNSRGKECTFKNNYDRLVTICAIFKVLGVIVIIAGWAIPIASL
ncbi:MAG: hypothetical protein GY765_09220 [bacterium]|nr:hypothetical protein [bacterium]